MNQQDVEEYPNSTSEPNSFEGRKVAHPPETPFLQGSSNMGNCEMMYGLIMFEYWGAHHSVTERGLLDRAALKSCGCCDYWS